MLVSENQRGVLHLCLSNSHCNGNISLTKCALFNQLINSMVDGKIFVRRLVGQGVNINASRFVLLSLPKGEGHNFIKCMEEKNKHRWMERMGHICSY